MKNLNKLQIIAEKLLKNVELLTLKGGYGGGTQRCCRARDGGGAIHASLCLDWNDADALLPSWCAFWSSAGYTIECDIIA